MSILITTKLQRSAVPPNRVERPRLIERLNEGLAAGHQVLLVSAPAGYGKTTCVSEWAAGLPLPCAWLALEPTDDEPGRFFTYLVAALQSVDARLCQELDAVLRSGQVPPADMLSAALINDIQLLDRPFVLVLDDLHVIQDALVNQVLERLVSNQPHALRLVLLTREDPALPLARLRARNRLTEVRAEDLTFTRAEARSFMNGVMGLSLSEADVAALEERTEGWIAGLQLAAIAMRPSGSGQEPLNPSEFIAGLSGSQRFILSYLTEEVLRAQSEEIQTFLIQTSILTRFNADLCDALRTDELESAPPAGTHASSYLLDFLSRANLFLIRLDEEGSWYRYHHLFASLLRSRLKSSQAGQTAELHRRASRWYARAAAAPGGMDEQVFYASEAIEHALAAADYPAAIGLIETYAAGMIMQWYARRIQTWIKTVPVEWSARSPRVNLTFAWMHLSKGDFSQAAQFLERLGAIFSDPQQAHGAGLQAEWLALQATCLNGQGRPAEGLALASQALGLAPAGDSPVQSQIYMCLAGAYQQMDDTPRAAQAYQELIRLGRASDSLLAELNGLSGLGLMLIERGQLRAALDLAARGVERIEQAGQLPPVAAGVFGELGQIYYEWHQLDQAEHFISRAAQVSRLSGFSDAEIYADIIHSRLAQAQGDLETAARDIQSAVDRMRAEAPAVVREEVVMQQVRLYLAQDRLAAAEAALAGYSAGETTLEPSAGSAGLRLPDIQPERPLLFSQARLILCGLTILLYRGRRQGGPADLRRGIALAGRLIDAALQRHFVAIAIAALLLRAQMQAALGGAQPSTSRADLMRALELAEPEGFVEAFVEGGPPVAQALKSLLAAGQPGERPSERLAGFIRGILAAFPAASPGAPTPASAPPAGLVEALTERELEVLRLMAEGLKYAEIAARLFISLNTVRTYVKEIYGKLNVDNRTRAVLLARQHGLI